MHPGPVNRGVELAADVIDGPQAVITAQVEAGIVVRMAVLYELVAGAPAAEAPADPAAAEPPAAEPAPAGMSGPTVAPERRPATLLIRGATCSIRGLGIDAATTCWSATARSPRSGRPARCLPRGLR